MKGGLRVHEGRGSCRLYKYGMVSKNSGWPDRGDQFEALGENGSKKESKLREL